MKIERALALLSSCLMSLPLPGSAAGPRLQAPLSIEIAPDALPSPPKKPAQPAVVHEGGAFTLRARADGSPPLHYQWLLDRWPLGGATNDTYTILHSETSDEGRYSIRISNAEGVVTSEDLKLLVANRRPKTYALLSLPGSSVTKPDSLRIDYLPELGTPNSWISLNGRWLTNSPPRIADPDPSHQPRRFYKTTPPQELAIQQTLGWVDSSPVSTSYRIEKFDPDSEDLGWQTVQTLTLTNSPLLFVDLSATNKPLRQYRTRPIPTAVRQRQGRLLFSARWILPEELYGRLTSDQKRSLGERHGVRFEDQDHSLQMITNPLPGYWVVVGNQRAMTDLQGNFSIEVPDGVTNGYVVPRYGDRSTRAEAEFNTVQLAPSGQSPVPIVIYYARSGRLKMDGDLSTSQPSPGLVEIRLADVLCGNPAVQVGNTQACCLDYDGDFPTDCKGAEDTATAVSHYIGSTCYRLVNAGLCIREWNALRFPNGLPTWPGEGNGPSCFENHRFRNCQNIDGELALSIAAVQKTGDVIKIRLVVHNNTWANETVLSVNAGVLLEQSALDGGPEIVVNHFNTTRHLKSLTVDYFFVVGSNQERPPPFGRYILQAQAGGTTRTFDLSLYLSLWWSVPG